MNKREGLSNIGGRLVTNRMSAAEEVQLVAWLKDWEQGRHGRKLRWENAVLYSGFSRQTLFARPVIRVAFDNAKKAIKKNFRHAGADEIDPSVAERLAKYGEQLKVLEAQHDRWLELWERWTYNAQQQGWDIKLLDRPLPLPIHRTMPRHTR